METTGNDASAPTAVIGIDLGGTKLMAGLFDSRDELVARHRIEVSQLDTAGLLVALVTVIDELRAASAEPVAAVGCGIPTTIDQRTGIAVQAANLPIADVPVRDVVQERTRVPVFLDNDANVAALAEHRRGAGRGVDGDLIMITLGTGLGGGIVVDDRIVRGSIGAGAELGHVSIDADGERCTAPNCPGIGCLEGYVSGNAIRREVERHIEAHPDTALAQAVADGEPAAGETVVRLADAGDTDCRVLLTRMGGRLGVGLANFVNIFNPRLIVVGGGLTPALGYLLPPARQLVLERALRPGNDYVEIVEASFGPDAGMVGAALMARDALRERTRNGHPSVVA